MTTDLASLRSELKAFERDFKGKHGREPSVSDIKSAGFADRYKLYKKLCKSVQSVSSSSLPLQSSAPGARPSTPPRSVPRQTEAPTSIIPKSRAVKTQIASSSNPFSPVKDKGKHKQVAQNRSPDHPPLPNPFATPIKAKATAKSQQRPASRPLSPDPFPLIQDSQSRANPQHEAGSKNPVSRARKRLRGEPVSPSPVKEKRQRIVSHDVLPFPDLKALAADDSDTENHSQPEQANSSFVAASPVKAPPNGVDFKLLFDEDASAQSSAKVLPKPNFGRSKSIRSSNGLFGSSMKRVRSASMSSDEMTVADNTGPTANKTEKDSNASRRNNRKRTLVNGFAFGKNNLFDTSGPSEEPPKKLSSSRQLQGYTAEQGSGTHLATKRPLPTAEPEPRIPLLPPSPPPTGSSSSKTKGKGKAFSRKKPKLSEALGDDEDEDSQDENDIRVREWSWQRRQRRDDGETQDSTSEPDLGLGMHDRTRRVSSPGPASDDSPGEFDVNLPEDLRRMLAISKSRALDPSEQDVVRSLLYGQRAGHYDASKGGDIYGVGEIGDGTEGEDDWDAEPVPWEVGEL